MINLILFCFGTASLTMFLDMCFQKGMIFHKYYQFIDKKVYPKFPRLYKVLGGCYYCYGTWTFLILYMLSIAEFSTQIVLGIGFNFVFIKLIERF